MYNIIPKRPNTGMIQTRFLFMRPTLKLAFKEYEQLLFNFVGVPRRISNKMNIEQN
jgi:hypothetical protein